MAKLGPPAERPPNHVGPSRPHDPGPWQPRRPLPPLAYIRYKDGTEELYDCKTDDPWNYRNLLAGEGRDKYTAVISEHKKWLPATEAPERESLPNNKKRQNYHERFSEHSSSLRCSSPCAAPKSRRRSSRPPSMPENPPKTWLTYPPWLTLCLNSPGSQSGLLLEGALPFALYLQEPYRLCLCPCFQ